MEKGFSVDMYGYLVAIFSAACLVAVLILGIIKLQPKTQFWFMSIGFTLSVPCMIAAYFSRNFVLMCIFAFAAGFLNCVGNTVFNASMMLALPEQNRSAILGVFRSGSVGGSALSAVIYGFWGELFPLYIVFAIGSALSLPLMIFMCFHPKIKRFIQSQKTLVEENV